MHKRVVVRGDNVFLVDRANTTDLGSWKTVLFSDTLKLQYHRKDGSTLRIYLKSTIDGVDYDMMFPELMDMLYKTTLKKGVVSGIWGFAKHGKTGGIKFMNEDRHNS